MPNPNGYTMDSYDEMPTRLELAIALFTRSANSEAIGSVHARSIRVPTIENCTIDALAEHSGLSVNKVIVQLLQVALDEVFQGMPQDERDQVFHRRARFLGEVVTSSANGSQFDQAQKGDL